MAQRDGPARCGIASRWDCLIALRKAALGIVFAAFPASVIAAQVHLTGVAEPKTAGVQAASPLHADDPQLPHHYINGLFPEPVSTPYTLRVEVYADGGSDGSSNGEDAALIKPKSGFESRPVNQSTYSLPFESPDHFVDANKMVPDPKLAPIDLPTVRAAQLTEDEATAILAAAGWPADLIPQALAVAWCESKHSPGAIGDGGNSLGWFQLWTGWFHEGEDHFDALTNAKVALRVREVRGRWGGGGGWTCADLLGIP